MEEITQSAEESRPQPARALPRWWLAPILIVEILAIFLVPDFAYLFGASLVSLALAFAVASGRNLTEGDIIFRVALVCLILNALAEFGTSDPSGFNMNRFLIRLISSLVVAYPIVRVSKREPVKLEGKGLG